MNELISYIFLAMILVLYVGSTLAIGKLQSEIETLKRSRRVKR